MSINYDIKDIMTFLPHRYPFILVDRVLELTSGKTIRALKNVTINEPFSQGHFPGMPVMPGVMIIEAMAQAGAILVLESAFKDKRDSPMYFMGMDNVRFRKPVVPGDRLIMDVKLLKRRSMVVKMTGTASVDNQCVAEAQILATFGDIQI